MNWALGSIAIMTAWAIGWCLMLIVHPALRTDRAARLTAFAFAPLLGTAATSCLYWLWIVLLNPMRVPYLTLEAALLVGLIVAAAKRGRAVAPPPPRRAVPRRCWPLLLIALAAVVVPMEGVVRALPAMPHGMWDAWDLWNIMAKFLFHADRATWVATFAEPSAHSDYPLLLPTTVARVWHGMGLDDVEGPHLVALFFMLMLLLITFAGVTRLRGIGAGLVALVMLPVYSNLLTHATWLYADLPLTTMMMGAALATVLALEDRPHRAVWLMTAGALAGAAAWTKNEGLVFAVAVLASLSAALLWQERGRRAWQIIGVTALAAALPLVCVAWVKLVYAEPSYLLTSRGEGGVWAMIVDPQRHQRILRLSRFILTNDVGGRWLWLLLAAWVLLRGVRASAALALWTVVLLVQATAYYAVYLTTPLDLSWQLLTSGTRTFLHLWPLLALLPVVLVRPDHALAADACGPRL